MPQHRLQLFRGGRARVAQVDLVMAALRCGMESEAARLLDLIEGRRDETGAFWMGWQFVEAIDWPAERPSWTQAAYVLAVDALENHTPASRIFAD